MQRCLHASNRSLVSIATRQCTLSSFPRAPQRLPVHQALWRSFATVPAGDIQFGQPVHETHPHLLQAGELTPGITAQEYAERRSKLAAKLPKNAVAVLVASDVKFRSGAVFYEFHQDSNFFYLTGFNEPEAVAVIGQGSADDDHVFRLFVREKDPKEEQWEGIRSGTQAALDVFNADETGDIKDVERHLSPIINSASKVYTDFPSWPKSGSPLSRFLNGRGRNLEGLAKLFTACRIVPLKDTINTVRNLKSDAEIANMRRAGKASGRAYTAAMRQHWTKETDLAAFFDFHFRLNGCDGSAYIPVVAGGQNASIIHYTQNNHLLVDEQLVLVDAGGEYGGYITDITRSWPVSGKFSDAQRDLYSAVLNTQRQCISLCRENVELSLDQIHEAAESSLRDGLSQLGFDMSGKALETLFPHHLGHYVGLDVHDTPGQSRKAPLQARQCVTIEPGVYVPDDEAYPAHFRGMGIRIEDSVCVQKEHPLVLTTEAVKEIDDIEALRR